MIKKYLLNIVIMTMSVFFAFGIFELFLIIENSYKRAKFYSYEIEGTSYDFINPVSDVFNKNPLTINKHRMIILGDSFVQGLTCVFDKVNLSGHIEKLNTTDLAIFNLGIPGANPVDYFDFLLNMELSEKDKVLLFLYDNDINLNARQCTRSLDHAQNYSVKKIKHCEKVVLGEEETFNNSNIIQRINTRLSQIRTIMLIKEAIANITFLSRFLNRSKYQEKWANAEDEFHIWMLSLLKAIDMRVRSSGAEFHLLYYPNTNRITEEDPRWENWKDFSYILKSNSNIELYDPYEYFLEHALETNMVWSLTNKHPSCDAHKLMAEYVVKILAD